MTAGGLGLSPATLTLEADPEHAAAPLTGWFGRQVSCEAMSLLW
jgi:hypothetical protein